MRYYIRKVLQGLVKLTLWSMMLVLGCMKRCSPEMYMGFLIEEGILGEKPHDKN